MENKQERRTIGAELRAAGQGKELKISGMAARFNSLSEDLGGFREMLQPGCFTDALADPECDILCLYGHDGQPLGRTTSGTLKVTQTAEGLHYSCSLPDTQLGRDIHTLVSRGDVASSSFGFTIADNGQQWSEGGTRRLVTRVAKLWDVSPVNTPAYKATSVQSRSIAEARRFLQSRRTTMTASQEAARQDGLTFLLQHKH